jgi:hypothetical protein
MSEDEFTKLFQYMQTEFKQVRGDIGDVKDMVGSLQGSVDSYPKQVLEITQEHLMLAHKVDRIEHWVQQIAAKAGVKLEY